MCINFSGDSPAQFPRTESWPVEQKVHRLWPQKGYLRNIWTSWPKFHFPWKRGNQPGLAGMLQELAVPRASVVLEECERKLRPKAESTAVCLVVKQTFHSKYWCFFYTEVSDLQGKGQLFCFCASIYWHTRIYFNKADFKGINLFKGSLVEQWGKTAVLKFPMG